jgi:LEA14-like dessication related protein
MGRWRAQARRWAAGAAVTALAAGCAGLSGVFQDPDVHLDRVMLRNVSAAGGTLDLLVGVHNPNRFDLRGIRLQLGFDVEDSHVGDLEYGDEFRVQQGETTVLRLPLRFTWSGLAGAARTALGAGELPYTLKGQLTLDTPLGLRKVPFTRDGRVQLARGDATIPLPTGQ